MRFSLRSRVLVLLLLFLAQVTAATIFVSRLARRYGAASEGFRETLVVYRLTHALDARIHAAAMAGNDHLIAGAPPVQIARFRTADSEVRRILATLRGFDQSAGSEHEAFGEVETRYAEIAAIAGQLFAIEHPVGNPTAGALMERMDRAADGISALLEEVLSGMERRIDDAANNTERLSSALRAGALASLVAVVLLSGLAIALLNLWILRPLAEMRQAISSMQLGARPEIAGAPVRRRSPNELTEVSDRLRSKFREIGRLAELTRAINEGLSLEEVLELVYEKFNGLVPYDRIGLALVEDEGRTIRSRWARTRAPRKLVPDGYSAALRSSSLAQVLAADRPRILNDLVDYLEKKPESQATALIVSEGMRSSLTCPLALKGVPVGVMFFSSMSRDAYRDAHVDLFLQISGQLAAIVEKSRLHDELVQLNRLKNDFLGMAAHDIRNPAAAIGGYAEILLHDAPEDLLREHRRMLERIGALASEISVLLEGLLDVAVIEAGAFTLNVESLALDGFLREVEERNHLLAESKGSCLTVESSGGEIVRFDPLRIHQVLGNLIGNAVKFSPAGSSVRVEARVAAGGVTLAVRDEGPGIPPEEQARLFEVYSKTSIRPTAGERSTGLGLAICRKIVEAHGGSIGVESRPGAGSTFRFTLPRAS